MKWLAILSVMISICGMALHVLAANCCDDSIIIKYQLHDKAEVRAFLLANLPPGQTTVDEVRRFLAGEVSILGCGMITSAHSLRFDFPELDVDYMVSCHMPLVNGGFYDAREDVIAYLNSQVISSVMYLRFAFREDDLLDIKVTVSYTGP